MDTPTRIFRNQKDFKCNMVPGDVDTFIATLDEGKKVILTVAHKRAAEAIREEITKGFDIAAGRVQPNTPSTIAWKGGKSTPLIMTGDLRTGVMATKAGVTYVGKSIVSTIEMPVPRAGSNGVLGIHRKDKSFPYGLIHLFGGGRNMRLWGVGPKFSLPRRDYLTDAMKKGGQRAAAILAQAYRSYYDAFLSPTYFNQRILPFAYEKQTRIRQADIIAMAIPPSAQYASVGFGADFSSAFSLGFSAFTINSWFGTLAAGHAGMTKRTYLRTGRKSLYSR